MKKKSTSKTLIGTPRPSRTIVPVLPTCKIADVKLFHFTKTQNLESIARKGLLPGGHDASAGYDFDAVWAADKKQMFGERGFGPIWEDRPWILRDPRSRNDMSIVGIKAAGAKNFKSDWPYYYSKKAIPPAYLCIIDPSEYKKFPVKAAELKPPVPSLDLLRDPKFMSHVDSFAIRYHDAIGKGGNHFDYAFGNKADKLVIDFVIPKKVPAELEAKKGNLPPPGKQRVVVFGPAHEQVYMSSPIGKIVPIPKGYGTGKWWVVVKGKAYVKAYPKGFIFGMKPRGAKKFTEYKTYQAKIKDKPTWFIRAM